MKRPLHKHQSYKAPIRESRGARPTNPDEVLVSKEVKEILEPLYGLGCPPSLRSAHEQYLVYFKRKADNEGTLQSLRHLKKLYHVAKAISIGSSFAAIPFTKSKAGVPCVLRPFLKYLKNEDPKVVSITLTLLGFFHAVPCKAPPDFGDILSPWSCEYSRGMVEDFRNFVKSSQLLKFIKSLQVDKPKLRIHATGAQGVFGHMLYSQTLERAGLDNPANARLVRAQQRLFATFKHTLLLDL
jgi:hypothetical protein